MTPRRLTVAGLTLVLAVLLFVLFWRYLLGLTFGVLALRLLWLRWTPRRPARRHGHGFFELLFGFIAGWWGARKTEDMVRSAVRNGGEIQIIAKPGSRYTTTGRSTR